MYLEKWGRFFFSKLNPLLFFFLIATPILISSIYLFTELNNLHQVEERFSRAAKKEKTATYRKGRKERFLSRYTNCDPYYIDRYIESFPLLQAEEERLSNLARHPAFPDCAAIKERLSLLKENRLSFVEENILSSPKVKEVEEKQRRSVQMDENDLQNLLSLIEDLSSNSMKGAPQLVIKDFRLKRIETPLHTELFEVNMDLIKREFSK
jgi:hypothetical protein